MEPETAALTTGPRRHLRAGPLRLDFRDGELRYLRVGDREIVRRIYFAVRDAFWDTPAPRFERVNIDEHPDHFAIDLNATCRTNAAALDWQGRIVGSPQGKITMTVRCAAIGDFESPRIGICVLYGAQSLAGQACEVVDPQGDVSPCALPRLIAPHQISQGFRTLRYTTDEGIGVAVALEASFFDMEDQRNYCDSSFKAFTGGGFAYPQIARGQADVQTVVVTVDVPEGASRRDDAEPSAVHRVRLGSAVPGARLPRVLPAEAAEPQPDFTHHNRNREQLAHARWITVPFNPGQHLHDADTFMENIAAIGDQVDTLRSFAPRARIRVAPIALDSPYPGARADRHERFDTAWCARMLKHLALAGVDEARFSTGTTSLEAVARIGAGHENAAVLQTSVGPHEDIDVLAVEDADRPAVWLINKIDEPRQVIVEGHAPIDLSPFALRMLP